MPDASTRRWPMWLLWLLSCLPAVIVAAVGVPFATSRAQPVAGCAALATLVLGVLGCGVWLAGWIIGNVTATRPTGMLLLSGSTFLWSLGAAILSVLKHRVT